MAIDTRDKRFSLLGMCQAHGAPVVFPNPDGTIDHTDFEHLLYGYDGIEFAGPGDPRMTRWGGVPHMRVARGFAGRSW